MVGGTKVVVPNTDEPEFSRGCLVPNLARGPLKPFLA